MDSKTRLHSESDLPSSRRFNPTAIGRRPPVLPREDLRAAPLLAGSHLSRRAFLSLSGLATVGGVLHANAQPFSILREGRKLHIALDAERRWTIDPEHFGPTASTRLRYAPRAVTVSLRNAFFPGTTLPADFVCTLREVNGSWRMLLRMFGGTVVAANLVDWLRGEHTQPVAWRALSLQLAPTLSLRSLAPASLRFTPDWILHVEGDLRTGLSAFETPFASQRASLRLETDTALPTLAAGAAGPRTLLDLQRTNASWPVDLALQSARGWTLRHQGELFDSLSVEAIGYGDNAVRTALFSPRPGAALEFSPGGGLRNALDQPVTLALQRVRLLQALEGGAQSMLLGSLKAGGQWVRGHAFSMLVAAHPSGQGDEFVLEQTDATAGKDAPIFKPSVLQLRVHGGAGERITVHPDASLSRPWAWSTNIQGIEGILGALHLDPWEHHLHFDLEAGDRICLLSVKRQMLLTCAFQRMRLHFPFLGHPVIRPIQSKQQGATYTVILSPQYTAPQAFFGQKPKDPKDHLRLGDVEHRPLQNVSQIKDKDIDPDSDPLEPVYQEQPYIGIRFRSAGFSQFVYNVRPDQFIPCSEAGLQDFSKFTQKLAPVAEWNDTVVPAPEKGKYPLPVDPQIYPVSDSGGTLVHNSKPDYAQHVTAIEMPWRLYLSPTGGEVWQHELEAKDYDNTGIFELWHSRLGVVNPLNLDEKSVPAPAKPMTARAIWTPGFDVDKSLPPHRAWPQPVPPPPVSPPPFDPTDPEDPFRMAFDHRDRIELVHLTSNFGLHTREDDTISATAPLRVDQWIVSTMGGYLRSTGSWTPPRIPPANTDAIGNTLTVEHWADITVLGNPVFDEIDYKGYLLPFGHRASLAKVTEKRIFKNDDGKVLFVDFQHMFIKISNKDRCYTLAGQPFDGREFNFSRVEALTARTPDLVSPDTQLRTDVPNAKQTQSLFWPCVTEGLPFPFHFRFHHKDGTTSEASAQVAFAGADVAQTTSGASEAVGFYNHANRPMDGALTFHPIIGNACVLDAPAVGQSLGGSITIKAGTKTHSLYVASGAGLARLQRQFAADPWFQTNGVTATLGLNELTLTLSSAAGLDLTGTTLALFKDDGYLLDDSDKTKSPWRTSDFADKKVVFATPGKPGDTQFHCDSILWRADASDTSFATLLYKKDLPFFFPVVHLAKVISASTRRIAPATEPCTVAFYEPYLEAEFDLRRNRGEVFLEVIDHPASLSFSHKVDQSGGLVSPDSLTVGYARAAGPVGGRLEDVKAALAAHALRLANALFPPPQPPVPLFAPALTGAAALVRQRYGQASQTTASTQSSLDIHASGSFDPSTFFAGLASARILAGIKLADVISFLVNALASAAGGPPQMLEQLIYLTDEATGVLKSGEVAAFNIVHSIQDFKVDNQPDPLAKSLAPEAQAVYDSFAQIKNQPAGQITIAQATTHAAYIASLIAYATKLEGRLANPGQLAQQLLMDQISKALGPHLLALRTKLDTAAGPLLASLDEAFANKLDDISATLAAYEKIAETEVVDPLVRLTESADTIVKTSFKALEPELNAILDVLPLVDDLRTRCRALRSAAPALPILLPTLLPILDDLLRIGDRLGALHYAGDLQAQANVIQNQLIAIFDFVPAQNLLDDFAPKAWIFAEELSRVVPNSDQSIEKGRQALQAYNQLFSAYKRLTDTGNPLQSTGPVELQPWVISQAKRRLKRVILTSLQTLQTLAQDSAAASATDFLNALVVGPPGARRWLPSLLTGLDALADSKGFLTLVATYLQQLPVPTGLDVLQETLQANVVDATVLADSLAANLVAVVLNPPPTTTLSAAVIVAQNQLLTGILKLQQPFALVHAFELYQNYTTVGPLPINIGEAIKALKATVAPFILVYQTIGNLACTQINELLAAWAPVDATIKTVGLAATVLVTPLANINKAITEYNASFKAPATCPPSLSQALHHLHHIAAALQGLADAVANEFAHLANDAGNLVRAAEQVLQLRNVIPPPFKLRLHLDWNPTLKSCEPVFLLRAGAELTIKAESIITLPLNGSPPTPVFNIESNLTNFSINLIGHPSFVVVDVEHFRFTASAGHQPNCDLKIANVRFGQDMSFVADLAKLLNPKEGPFLDFIEDGVLAGFRFHVPDIKAGGFSMRQLSLNVGVNLPFSGKPVRCIFGISTFDNPFLISVGIYGGGGFLQLHLGLDGVEILEGSLEFGLMGDISILAINGWGKVVAGIYFRLERNKSTVCGFFHAHGHFDIFGIVSMDIDLKVIVCYIRKGDQSLVRGEADFTVDIDILFFSVSFAFHAVYEYGDAKQAHGIAPAHTAATASSHPPVAHQLEAHEDLSNERMTSKRWGDYLNNFAPAELAEEIYA